MIGVDDRQRVWVGGIGIWSGTYNSQTDEVDWVAECQGDLHVDQQVMAFDSPRRNLWVGNDGGVGVMDLEDPDPSWQSKNSEQLVLTQHYPGGGVARLGPDADRVATGTQDVGIVLHQPDGTSAQAIPVGWWTDGAAAGIAADDPDAVLVSKLSNKVYKSTTGGEPDSWVEITPYPNLQKQPNRMELCPVPGSTQSERAVNTVFGQGNLTTDLGDTAWALNHAAGTSAGLAFVSGTSAASPCDSYWISTLLDGGTLFRHLDDDFGEYGHCSVNPACTELPSGQVPGGEIPGEVVDFASIPGYDYDSRRVLYASTGAACRR